jgi:CPA2 family monovalent cation:H+ antiporter-2
MAVTAISMALTPLILLLNERLVLPRFGILEQEQRAPDQIERVHQVIIAGFGAFGSTLGRFLRANGVEATILDNDSDRVDLLRRMGFKVFYGDATRLDILRSAGADHARILVVAMDNLATSFKLIETARKQFPNLRVMARAGSNLDAHELLDLGVSHIYRDFLDTAVRAGVDVLTSLGQRRFTSTRSGQDFIRYDEDAMLRLAPHRHDQSTYISTTKEQILLQEQLLASDRQRNQQRHDHAWDSANREMPD